MVSVGEKVVAMCRLGQVGQSGILLFGAQLLLGRR